ncbi:MAG: putative rane protein [Acidobacteriaceae bacterium]|nr:putative rane protein [Acidobacteriaceae bacterium]
MMPDPHPPIAPRPSATHQSPSREADQRLELAIATLLRIGVVLAAVLVALGGVLVMRHPGAPVPSYTQFHPPGSLPAGAHALTSITGVFRHLADPSGASIIELGLLVLIATPIARVLFAVVGFARERDYLYVVISLLVFGILLVSLLHGR